MISYFVINVYLEVSKNAPSRESCEKPIEIVPFLGPTI
jgi:hypothetical protein